MADSNDLANKSVGGNVETPKSLEARRRKRELERELMELKMKIAKVEEKKKQIGGQQDFENSGAEGGLNVILFVRSFLHATTMLNWTEIGVPIMARHSKLDQQTGIDLNFKACVTFNINMFCAASCGHPAALLRGGQSKQGFGVLVVVTELRITEQC